MNWHDYFIYDANAGHLIWRIRPDMAKWWNTKYAGKVAGTPHIAGYVKVSLGGKTYLVHRIISEIQDGPLLPGQEIDHIDGNRTNNRWSNLRRCTRAQNAMNRGKLESNTSGFKGVFWNRKLSKWQAKIGVFGIQKHLGFYPTPELAHAAYCDAAMQHDRQFARTI